MQSSSNASLASANTSESSSELSKKVESIIEWKFAPEVNTKLIKIQILEALSWDKKKALFLLGKWDIDLYHYLPVNLKEDEDIAKNALEKDPSLYHSLPQKLRQSKDIKILALEWLVETRSGLYHILNIIENDPKTSTQMLTLFSKLVKKDPDYFRDESTKLLYELYISDAKLYSILKEKWFISLDESGLSVGSKFAKYLKKFSDDLESLSPEECQDKLYQLALDFIWVVPWKQDTALEKCIRSITSAIHIAKHEPEEEDEVEIEQSREELDDQWDDTHLSYGPYNYAPIWESCRVWDNAWNDILLEKQIFHSMSERSLENYMNFYISMQDIWLWFLLDSQNARVQTATGINFYEWEWMSQARKLRFINSIWKNIWIPEETYKDSEGNPKVWCFQSWWEWKKRFEKLRDSRKIWEYDFNGVDIWSSSIVKMYMKLEWLLTEPFWELSIAKWKK